MYVLGSCTGALFGRVKKMARDPIEIHNKKVSCFFPPPNIAIENGPVEIVDLPIENGGSFHSYVTVYQRVSEKKNSKYHKILRCVTGWGPYS